MSAVSLLEDIQKVRDDAVHFRRLLIDNASFERPVQELAEQARKKIPGYLEILDKAIAHFDRILELATDPSMDLAEEILRLKTETATLKEKHSTEIEIFQDRIETQKSAAASSLRNFRSELKRREDEQKKKIAEITKSHVKELENQKHAHQIEKNGWLKELQENKSRAVVASAHDKSKAMDAPIGKLDFASALQSFEPKDEDVR